MDELIERAKRDTIVNFEYLINHKIHTFCAIPNGKMEKIVIYCHGLGSNKNWASRFYKDLISHNIGIIAFDFPGHGADKTNFSKFDLSLCIHYLNEVIAYAIFHYKVSVCLFGSSFGGFVILNRLLENNEEIDKTILMCPAINFCEIVEKKTHLSLKYYQSNLYVPLYNNIKIYKKAYLEFKDGDVKIKNGEFKNVFVIQGASDKTVLCDDIKEFCQNKKLKLKIIEGGKHELYAFDKDIIEFLLENL